MNDIDELKMIAPPPKLKNGAGSPAQWRQLEEEFALTFPDDYKELIATYGAGRFVNFFGIVNPFYTCTNDIAFAEFIRLRTADMARAKASYPKRAVSLPVYPQKGGLFPWGYTDNGETICWLTEGDKGRWPIICLEVGYLNNYDIFRLSIIQFIAKWLTNKISVPTLTPPDFYPLRSPIFVPGCPSDG